MGKLSQRAVGATSLLFLEAKTSVQSPGGDTFRKSHRTDISGRGVGVVVATQAVMGSPVRTILRARILKAFSPCSWAAFSAIGITRARFCALPWARPLSALPRLGPGGRIGFFTIWPW